MRPSDVRTCDDPVAACTEAITDSLRDAVARRGRALLVLAGGSTPRPVYEALALRAGLPWERVWILWGDERHVAPDDERRNERAARRALLDAVAIPEAQILPWPWRSGLSAGDAAAAFDAVVTGAFGAWPRFDFVLLGLGDDGHTASLFPRTGAALEPGPTLAVAPADQPEARLSMAAPALSNARRVVFLVVGEAKRRALETSLAGEGDLDRFPARAIQPGDGRLAVITDLDVGSG